MRFFVSLPKCPEDVPNFLLNFWKLDGAPNDSMYGAKPRESAPNTLYIPVRGVATLHRIDLFVIFISPASSNWWGASSARKCAKTHSANYLLVAKPHHFLPGGIERRVSRKDENNNIKRANSKVDGEYKRFPHWLSTAIANPVVRGPLRWWQAAHSEAMGWRNSAMPPSAECESNSHSWAGQRKRLQQTKNCISTKTRIAIHVLQENRGVNNRHDSQDRASTNSGNSHDKHHNPTLHQSINTYAIRCRNVKEVPLCQRQPSLYCIQTKIEKNITRLQNCISGLQNCSWERAKADSYMADHADVAATTTLLSYFKLLRKHTAPITQYLFSRATNKNNITQNCIRKATCANHMTWRSLDDQNKNINYNAVFLLGVLPQDIVINPPWPLHLVVGMAHAQFHLVCHEDGSLIFFAFSRVTNVESFRVYIFEGWQVSCQYPCQTDPWGSVPGGKVDMIPHVTIIFAHPPVLAPRAEVMLFLPANNT